MTFCLDTNIIIDIWRKKDSTKQKINSLISGSIITTNPVILYELYKGSFNSKNNNYSMKLINDFLEMTLLLQFDIKSSRIAGEIYAFMRKKGRDTPESDIMIAAICIANNTTLVTSNRKHFEKIPGLKVEFV